MKRAAIWICLGLAVFAGGARAQDKGGGNETLEAERQRVVRAQQDLNAILDTVPAGRGVAEGLRAEREAKFNASTEELLGVREKPAQPERDPFAVTPQLRARAGYGPGYIKPLPGMPAGDLPAMALRGLIGDGRSRVALIDVREMGLVRVRKRATFQLPGGVAFRVKKISDDSVVLETGHAETEFVLVR